MRTYKRPVKADPNVGLQEVYSGQNPTIDIIAIHGLNGSPTKSYTHPTNQKFWLAAPDMLPAALPNARILSYGYKTTIASFLGASSSARILADAKTFVTSVNEDRTKKGAANRPIIFLCHSLGGMILKRALVYLSSSVPKDPFLTSTYAVCYFGVPHVGNPLGSLAAFAPQMMKAMGGAMGGTADAGAWGTNEQMKEALNGGMETLKGCNEDYLGLKRESGWKWRNHSFWEMEKSDVGGSMEFIVEQSAAAPPIVGIEATGLPKDHNGVVLFASPVEEAFILVRDVLMSYAREAPSVMTG